MADEGGVFRFEVVEEDSDGGQKVLFYFLDIALRIVCLLLAETHPSRLPEDHVALF